MFDNEFNSIYWAVNEDLILACKQVASKRKYNGAMAKPGFRKDFYFSALLSVFSI